MEQGAVLRGVKTDSPYLPAARIAEAASARRLGDAPGAAAAVKAALAASRDREILLQAGEVLRGLDRHAEAEALFDEAVKADLSAGQADWRALFARAGEREALDRWPDAEEDLQRALELAPDEPDVLNFLGYAWVDRGEHVSEGLALIERAVQSEPDRGYIVDSLGWALFRLGRYEEAVTQLERAAELAPASAEVTDHLGDAYWRAGRRLEAGFQWRRAQQLSPDADLAARLRDKLQVGLPDEQMRTVAETPRARP